MSDELERQLEAFGTTLESTAGEPIRKGSAAAAAASPPSNPRRWALVGAAACLLAVVAGLLVLTGRDAEAPAAPPPTPTSTSTSIPLVVQTSIDPELLRTAPIAGVIDGCGPDEVLLTGNLAEIGGSLDAAFAIAYDSIIEHTPPEVERLPVDGWTIMANEPVSVVFLDRGAGIEAIVRIPHDDEEWRVAEIAQCLPGRIQSAIQTTTTTITPSVEAVPDDPLALERDGWTLAQRSTDPFDYEADALPVPCPQATVLEGFNGTPQVVDTLEHPTFPSVDVLVLDVGSAEAGTQLADAFLGIAECAGDAVQSDVTTMALSSIRATWFRAGSELAIATVVGEQERSVVLAFEEEGITDDLIGELARRADQFLRGAPISGTDSTDGITVTDGLSLGEPPAELVPGQVLLWVGNQSFEDDPVAITVAIDGVQVVDDSFLVGGQHNWFSFMIDGLEPGEHTLSATSDTGAVFEATFTLPPDEPRWMVVDYWYYPDDELGRHFTFSESDEPIYFA